MNPGFILKRPDSVSSTAVIMLLNCSDGRLKYYTGLSVMPDEFDSDMSLQFKLAEIRKELRLLASDLKLRGQEPTKQLVTGRLNKLLKKQQRNTDFFVRMQEVIDRMEAGKIQTPQKKRYSAGSIKTFRFTKTLLERFDSAMSLETITMQTYYSFISWCHGKDYATNYIGSQIKNWKSLCKRIGKSEVIESEEFKQISEDAFDIYLDEKEILSIYNQACSKREDLVRDWFILNCYAGLRVSDLTILDKKNNLSKDFITIANEKTDVKVVIPLHPLAKKIIEKYKGFPPKVSDQELNREIKVVAKNAGIKKKVLSIITKGGIRQDQYLPKYMMVSNHTARRSFITNLLKNGVADTIVMKLTGIKSHQTLKRYTKLSPDEAAEIAAGHDFFKQRD